MRPGSTGHLARRPHDKWEVGGILLPESLVTGAAPSAVAKAMADKNSAHTGKPAVAPKLDLTALFGNLRPVEIEIGTGKGTFLLARASARPEMNFLGIEWAKAYAAYAADRFHRAGLTNVRMIRCDASHFFSACLADRSVWRVHVYFPDPWPKRRHHRRRLIQPAFVQQVRRVLRPGGQLILVTDHLDYFRHIEATVKQVSGLAATPMLRMADREGELVGTNFERKYIAQGRPFYHIARMRYG